MGSDDFRVLFSPGFNFGEEYDSEVLVNYNVECPEDKPSAYFFITDLVLEGECEGVYVHIIMHTIQFSTHIIYSNVNTNPQHGKLQVAIVSVFHTL